MQIWAKTHLSFTPWPITLSVTVNQYASHFPSVAGVMHPCFCEAQVRWLSNPISLLEIWVFCLCFQLFLVVLLLMISISLLKPPSFTLFSLHWLRLANVFMYLSIIYSPSSKSSLNQTVVLMQSVVTVILSQKKSVIKSSSSR